MNYAIAAGADGFETKTNIHIREHIEVISVSLWHPCR